MKVKVNSTGRRRIEPKHASVAVRRPVAGGRPRIEPRFELAELGLPAEAWIVVEAYRSSFTERFGFGTVAAPAAEGAAELAELGEEGLKFRVKVVEPGTGRLLALARELRPDSAAEAARKELFRVRPADLGEELWRVELADDDLPPWLLLSNRLPDPVARFREPVLRAAVLPAAMRVVLLAYCLQGIDIEQDEPDAWTQRWLRFAETLAGEERPSPGEAPDEALRWVDKACAAFAKAHAFAGAALAAVTTEGEA